jgi:AcrR family transcriptional regulator
MTAPAGLPALPSDLPRRTAGTRVRSGNAMERTRTAVLDAAAHCVERYGVRRTTMGDIALKAAVAKGTLYNHFRTKDDVLAALVLSRAAALAATCRAVAVGDPLPAAAPGLPVPELGAGLAAALETAAAGLASDGPLRRLVADDPGLAAPLLAAGEGRGWEQVRTEVRGVLEAAGADGGDDAVALVLRWLVSQVVWPARPDEARAAAARLAVALGG